MRGAWIMQRTNREIVYQHLRDLHAKARHHELVRQCKKSAKKTMKPLKIWKFLKGKLR